MSTGFEAVSVDKLQESIKSLRDDPSKYVETLETFLNAKKKELTEEGDQEALTRNAKQLKNLASLKEAVKSVRLLEDLTIVKDENNDDVQKLKKWTTNRQTRNQDRQDPLLRETLFLWVPEDEIDHPLASLLPWGSSHLLRFCNKKYHTVAMWGGAQTYEATSYEWNQETNDFDEIKVTKRYSSEQYAVALEPYTGDDLKGRPYDVEVEDLRQPTQVRGSSAVQNPEIIVHPNGDGSFDVAWRDQYLQDPTIRISRYKKSTDGAHYECTATLTLSDTLHSLGGFTKDAEGNYYILTGVDEDLEGKATADETSKKTSDPDYEDWRSGTDVLRLLKYNSSGAVQWKQELNKAEYAAEPIFVPLAGGTSRLVYGNGKLFALFAKHTPIDWKLGGRRHQNALTVVVNASDGKPAGTGNGFGRVASHSFDQRAIYSESEKKFVYVQKGDSFPQRALGIGTFDTAWSGDKPTSASNGFSKDSTRSYYFNDQRFIYAYNKTDDYNNCFTRLGNVQEGEKGYVVLFATERVAAKGKVKYDDGRYVREPLRLALVHVPKNFASQSQTDAIVTKSIVDTSGTVENIWSGEKFSIDGKKNGQNVNIVWLTPNYGPIEGENAYYCAARPKLVKLSSNRFVAIWEKWKAQTQSQTQAWPPAKSDYVTTCAMVIDEYGNVKVAEKELGYVRLPQSDEPVQLEDNLVAWVNGDMAGKALKIHTLDNSLTLASKALSLDKDKTENVVVKQILTPGRKVTDELTNSGEIDIYYLNVQAPNEYSIKLWGDSPSSSNFTRGVITVNDKDHNATGGGGTHWTTLANFVPSEKTETEIIVKVKEQNNATGKYHIIAEKIDPKTIPTLTVGQWLKGQAVTDTRPSNVYQFHAAPNTSYSITVDPSSNFDPELKVGSMDLEDSYGDGSDESITYSNSTSHWKLVEVTVTGFIGSTGSYELKVSKD